MEWTQFILFAISVFGLFIWNRAESRADMRHMDIKLESNRSLTIQIHNEIKEEMKSFREDNRGFREEMKQFREIWMQESKDFHKRLCEIEARKH